MTKRTTPIILDRLDASLKQHGVRLRRSQLLETAASAFGYRNSHEFDAADREGSLAAPRPDVLGRIAVGDETLVALRDTASGSIYAIDESFLDQVVEEERRERLGPSPYGGLVDLSEVAASGATMLDATPAGTFGHTPQEARYHAYDGMGALLGAEHDLDRAKALCDRRDGRSDLESWIIDDLDWTVMRAKHCWRAEPMEPMPATRTEAAETAARLLMANSRIEDLANQVSSLVNTGPDWRNWERDLKKASHMREEPIGDEALLRFRHAVADNHCKSSSGEREQVRYRVQRFVEKHLGGLLARLDRAEDALRDAGLSPKEIARKSKDDAAELLAAIEAVVPRGGSREIPGLYELDATRDGDICRETFLVPAGEDPEDAGRAIAAREFRMNLEEHRYDGSLDSFDAECDTFSVRPVEYPEAASVISDALAELSAGGDFRYGIPHDHPARVKLIAARAMLVPKPTA